MVGGGVVCLQACGGEELPAMTLDLLELVDVGGRWPLQMTYATTWKLALGKE